MILAKQINVDELENLLREELTDTRLLKDILLKLDSDQRADLLIDIATDYDIDVETEE